MKHILNHFNIKHDAIEFNDDGEHNVLHNGDVVATVTTWHFDDGETEYLINDKEGNFIGRVYMNKQDTYSEQNRLIASKSIAELRSMKEAIEDILDATYTPKEVEELAHVVEDWNLHTEYQGCIAILGYMSDEIKKAELKEILEEVDSIVKKHNEVGYLTEELRNRRTKIMNLIIGKRKDNRIPTEKMLPDFAISFIKKVQLCV